MSTPARTPLPAPAPARDRGAAVLVALAPLVLLAALVAHPFITVLPDADAVAGAVAASTARWGAVHLLTALGIALVALALVAVREWLRDAGEDRFSRWALPWALLGSAAYGLLPGMEFAPLAAARTGGDVVAVQESLAPWYVAVLGTSAILFATGALGFAGAIATSRVLSPWATRVAVTGLVVLALSRFAPLGAVQFYVQAAAGLAALWPLAHRMWSAGPVAVPRQEPRPGARATYAAARPSG